MKKLIRITITVVIIVSSLHGAMLKTEVEQGLKKICIYDDGTTKTIMSHMICPLTKY
jgi:hypothetical protein